MDYNTSWIQIRSLKSTLFLHLCNSKQLQKYTCITLRCIEATETSTTCLLSKLCSDECSPFVAIYFSFHSVIPTGSSCASRKSHKDRACPVHPFTTWDLFIYWAPLSSAKKKTLVGYFLHSCHIVENRKKNGPWNTTHKQTRFFSRVLFQGDLLP
jgi:hypothetical protein